MEDAWGTLVVTLIRGLERATLFPSGSVGGGSADTCSVGVRLEVEKRQMIDGLLRKRVGQRHLLRLVKSSWGWHCLDLCKLVGTAFCYLFCFVPELMKK